MPDITRAHVDHNGDTEEWIRFKSHWLILADLSPEEHQQYLSAPEITPALRARLQRMLDAAPNIGGRFDEPAHVALGFQHTLPTDLPSASLVGQRLGPYRVQRLVGRGGMGAVYEAERDDAQYTQRVAIKTLWRGADSEVLLQRFRSERQILAALQHPNIAQLIDGGATQSGTPWLAMEFVDGVAIDRYCDDHRLGIPERLDLFRAVCMAVAHAHTRLVVHRDLKPSNVLVTADGTVKLLDFGVAKLLDDSGAAFITAEGLSPFTAAYAAPEQASGEVVSTATDVYSLGALLCTLLAGAPPLNLDGKDALARLVEVRTGTPRHPKDIARQATVAIAAARGFESPARLSAALAGELDAIVLQALHRDPSRRYPGAMALREDVLRYLRRERVHARPATLGYRAWSFTRRNRTLVVAGVLGAATAIGISVMSMQQAKNLRVEAERAERAANFMAGIMSGTSTASQDPVVRVGPAGTVGQLLDSAVTRVPRAFPTDDRIRSRLYTAFGANYATQARYSSARLVLDSARLLARRAYGPESDAHARACLESAMLEIVFHGAEAANEPITAAAAAVGVTNPTSELSTRLMLLRALQALGRGRMRLADSLAALVSVRERQARGLTVVVASAENVRMATTSWITRDPRAYLRQARWVESITDSLGLTYSNERDQAADAAIEAMLVLGRADSAETRTREQVARLERTYGSQATVQVWAAKSAALLASLRGDTAKRRVELARGRAIVDTMADFPLIFRTVFNSGYVDDALARNDHAAALSMALATRDKLRPTASPLYLSFAYLYTGAAYLAQRDAVRAEAELRAGLDAIAAVPDLASMGPRLRRPLVEALVLQGKLAEADSVRRLDPPKASRPPCTPGGNWVGCPDR